MLLTILAPGLNNRLKMNRPKHLSSNLIIQSPPKSTSFLLSKQLITLPGSQLQAWTCLFETEHINDEEFHFLINSSSLSQRAVPKRKAEHVAGRLCINWCYQMLTNQTPPIIHSDNHGCPIWPFPFKGSISHSNGMAVGALINKANILSLGVDVETILDDKTTKNIFGMILTPAEQAIHINPVSEKMTFNSYVTLIFSAKESIYKALYPLVKHFFDFSAASVTSVNGSKIKFTLHSQALPEIFDKTLIEVAYKFENNRVLTTCVVEDTFLRYLR
jgi:enterobactin synthetase component D